MKADITLDIKTRKRTEDAEAHRAKYGDNSSTKRVDAGPTSSTSLGMKAEPPVLPLRDDALVNKDAAVPKPCLSDVEMLTLTAAGSVLPAGTAKTEMKTTCSRQLPSWTPGEETKKKAAGQT